MAQLGFKETVRPCMYCTECHSCFKVNVRIMWLQILSFTRSTVQHHYLSVDPLGAIFRLLHSSIEVNRQHVLRARLLPGVSMSQPIIGLLHLCESQSGTKTKKL